MKHRQFSPHFRLFTSVLAGVFSLMSSIFPMRAEAQSVLNLPAPGAMMTMSPAYAPVMIKGIKIYPDNALRFDFIVDTGHSGLEGEDLQDEGMKLIKYFWASLAVPEEDMWVNLSPYESDRIIPEAFGYTEMGRDLLAQDYLLKQITASLMYPEDELGAEFWERIRQKAEEKYGLNELPINTFNKVWIIPEKAVVYENGDVAFVAESRLKVMLENDYFALKANVGNEKFGMMKGAGEEKFEDINDVSKEVIREIIIPELEREVNEGKNFAPLRQIYSAVILGTWFKKNFRQTVLGQAYFDQENVEGVDVEDRDVKQKIYEQYLDAFETGVYDYVKEEYDPATQQLIPRQYFSGGAFVGPGEAFETETMRANGTAVPVGEFIALGSGATFESETTGEYAMLGQRFVDFVQKGVNQISQAELELGALSDKRELRNNTVVELAKIYAQFEDPVDMETGVGVLKALFDNTGVYEQYVDFGDINSEAHKQQLGTLRDKIVENRDKVDNMDRELFVFLKKIIDQVGLDITIDVKHDYLNQDLLETIQKVEMAVEDIDDPNLNLQREIKDIKAQLEIRVLEQYDYKWEYLVAEDFGNMLYGYKESLSGTEDVTGEYAMFGDALVKFAETEIAKIFDAAKTDGASPEKAEVALADGILSLVKAYSAFEDPLDLEDGLIGFVNEAHAIGQYRVDLKKLDDQQKESLEQINEDFKTPSDLEDDVILKEKDIDFDAEFFDLRMLKPIVQKNIVDFLSEIDVNAEWNYSMTSFEQTLSERKVELKQVKTLANSVYEQELQMELDYGKDALNNLPFDNYGRNMVEIFGGILTAYEEGPEYFESTELSKSEQKLQRMSEEARAETAAKLAKAETEENKDKNDVALLNRTQVQQKRSVGKPSTTGGIDLSPDIWDLETTGQGVEFNVPAAFFDTQNMPVNFESITPFIFKIAPFPASQVPLILGASQDNIQKEHLSSI